MTASPLRGTAAISDGSSLTTIPPAANASAAELITVASPEAAAAALQPHAAICFALTNTRSLPVGPATTVAREFAGATFAQLAHLRADADVISRGDSMLRGYVWAELNAIRESV